MNIRTILCAGLAALLLTAANTASADWGVVLNGKSYHVNSSKDWNERNWGLGLEREFDSRSRWVKVAVVNGFKDSQSEMSYMAGGGLKRRFRLDRLSNDFFIDVGVVGFMMTRQDVNQNRPFPGLLPTLSFGTERMSLNLTYLTEQMMDSATQVTRVDPTVEGLVFLQLKLHPAMFGLGGGRRGGGFSFTD